MTLKRRNKLTTTVRVRFKAETKRLLVKAARAYGADTISDFVRELVEVNVSGDIQQAAEFARRLSGGIGEQLVLDMAAEAKRKPKKGGK